MSARLFHYTAFDASGNRQMGVLHATDENDARTALTRKGYLVETIVERVPSEPQQSARSLARASLESVQRFFSQLASTQKSGVPIVQALSTIQSSSSGALAAAVEEMRVNAEQGGPISEVMAKYPLVFPPLTLALVKAGEQSGTLDDSLHNVAEYLLREIRLRNRFRGATFYPKILFAVILLLPLVANLVIGFVASLTGGPRLPLVNLLENRFVVVFVVGLLLLWLVFFRYFNAVPAWRKAWDRLLLSIPHFGNLATMLAMAKFSRAIGALVGAGLPPQQSIRLSADATSNRFLAEQIYPAAEMVKEGTAMSEALRRTGAVTPIALDMIATGETAGNMQNVMEHVAQQYESEAELQIEKIIRVLPLLFLFIAALFIAYIVYTFYAGYVPALLREADA